MIKEKHDLLVIDAAAEKLGFKQIFKKIRKFNPEIIGITTNISIAYICCELALRIKINFPNKKIVMGGPWATSNFEYIINHKIGDYVIIGEGEYTFQKLLSYIESGKIEQIDEINGIAYRDRQKEVRITKRAPFIQDLDALPYPAWEYFPKSSKYFTHYRHLPLYPMMITRGCPYGCIHCTKTVHGYKIRKRSVENVIGEMKYLIEKFKANEIIIVDDNFTFDVDYANKILDKIIEEELNVHLLLPNGIRADTLTPPLLMKMRRAGVYGFAIGVESGVQAIVNKIGKKLDLNKVRNAARLAKRYGFLLRAFFILGLPYDSFDTMRQTIRFAREIEPDFAYFFIATLFPGTEMYDIVRDMGNMEDFMSDTCNDKEERENFNVDLGFFYKPVINFTYGKMKPGDVENAYKIAVRDFYMRPRKILSILGTIKSIPEIKWIFHYFIVSLSNIISSIFKKK